VGSNFPATTTASSGASLHGGNNSSMMTSPSTSPSPGSLGNDLFKDIMQNASSSFSHLVHEASTISLSLGKIVVSMVVPYSKNSLCRFNGLWLRLVDLHNWISVFWLSKLKDEAFIYPYAKGFSL
jgi:hypothetical protein